MGMITGLVTLPLAPVRGVVWLARTLQDEAERQWNDPAAIRRRLEDIEAAHRAGELDDEQRDELEAELIDRLLATRGAPADEPA